jgi:hypothetical protein
MMTSSQWGRFVLKTTLAFFSIVLITLVSFQAHGDFAVVMPLYLLVVVAQSLWDGFASHSAPGDLRGG